MRRIVLLALTLTGCGESALVDKRNASLDQVAAAVAKAGQPRLKPGRWESRVTLGDFNGAAHGPLLFAGLWSPGSLSANVASCIVPDAGARPDLALLRKAARDCSYDRFRMSTTAVKAQLTCKPGATRRIYIAINGTYSPDHFQLYLKADAPGATADSERIEYSTSINAIRNGKCRGNEEIVAAPAM